MDASSARSVFPETSLKKLENTLSGERNLLRSVINNIPDPIFVKDSQGRYVLDNVAHRHSVGKQHEEEIIGKTVFDFFSETSALNFSGIDETILKSGVPMISYEEEAIAEVQQFSASRNFNDDVCLVAMDIERLRQR